MTERNEPIALSSLDGLYKHTINKFPIAEKIKYCERQIERLNFELNQKQNTKHNPNCKINLKQLGLLKATQYEIKQLMEKLKPS